MSIKISIDQVIPETNHQQLSLEPVLPQSSSEVKHSIGHLGSSYGNSIEHYRHVRENSNPLVLGRMNKYTLSALCRVRFTGCNQLLIIYPNDPKVYRQEVPEDLTGVSPILAKEVFRDVNRVDFINNVVLLMDKFKNDMLETRPDLIDLWHSVLPLIRPLFNPIAQKRNLETLSKIISQAVSNRQSLADNIRQGFISHESENIIQNSQPGDWRWQHLFEIRTTVEKWVEFYSQRKDIQTAAMLVAAFRDEASVLKAPTRRLKNIEKSPHLKNGYNLMERRGTLLDANYHDLTQRRKSRFRTSSESQKDAKKEEIVKLPFSENQRRTVHETTLRTKKKSTTDTRYQIKVNEKKLAELTTLKILTDSKYDQILLLYCEWLTRNQLFIQRASFMQFISPSHYELYSIHNTVPKSEGCKLYNSKKVIICDWCHTQVRGLSMNCLKCLHGGHLKHRLDIENKKLASICPVADCECALNKLGCMFH